MFAETGTYVTSIDLEEFIKLYINHRPAFGIYDEFVQAFHVLGDFDSAGQLVLQKQELLKMLEEQGPSPCFIIYNILTILYLKLPLFSTGETMAEEEVLQCFTALLVFDDKEEEEKQDGESEQQSEHAADTSDGIIKIKDQNIALKNIHNKYNTHWCVFPGGCSESSLELMIPDQISMETFTCGILGLSSLAEQSGSPSSQAWKDTLFFCYLTYCVPMYQWRSLSVLLNLNVSTEQAFTLWLPTMELSWSM